MSIRVETFYLIISSFLIVACFYISFNEYVFKNYEYLGFVQNDNIILIFISILFFTIYYVSSKTNIERAMLTLIYPATIFASETLMTHTVLLLFFGVWLIVRSYFDKSNLSPSKLPINKWALIVVCILLVIVYTQIGHFDKSGFSSTEELYQAREVRKNSMSPLGFIFENLVTKQILPIFGFMLLVYFKMPKIFLILILISCGAIIFYLTTRKSLAVVLLLPILYPIIKASAVRFSVVLVSGLLTLILLSQILFETPYNFIISTLLRRLFFTPAMVLEAYVNYFADHRYTLFGHTFLKFFDSEFTYLPPLVATYSFGYHFNANTGAIGNAFAGFGLIGVGFISALLSFMFNFLYSRSTSELAYIPATLFFMSVVTNNDFYVLLTGHGFFMLFIFMFITVKR